MRLAQPVEPRGIDITLLPARRQRRLTPRRDLPRSASWWFDALASPPLTILPVENLTPEPCLAQAGPQPVARFHLPGHGIAPLAARASLGDVVRLMLAVPT